MIEYNTYISKIVDSLPAFEAEFFLSIRASGVDDGTPFIELANGDILFGFSNASEVYYKPVFEKLEKDLVGIGLRKEAFGAAFDAMISYHYENSTLWQNKSSLIKKGDVVLDVGVRGGHFTVKASRLTGPEGLVVAIDPTEFAKQRVELHARKNGLKNVRFVQAAVSQSDDEEVEFFSGSPGESFSGFFDQTVTVEGEAVVTKSAHTGKSMVKTISLDTLVEREGLSKVDYVIIQINGAERLAVKGMRRLLSRFRPKLFITASHGLPGDISAREVVLNEIEPYGYENYSYEKTENLILRPVKS